MSDFVDSSMRAAVRRFATGPPWQRHQRPYQYAWPATPLPVSHFPSQPNDHATTFEASPAQRWWSKAVDVASLCVIGFLVLPELVEETLAVEGQLLLMSKAAAKSAPRDKRPGSSAYFFDDST